jgi:uncharacterized Zn finger protein
MVAIVVTEESVRQLAGDQSYQRGNVYFAAGRVRELMVDGTVVRATVQGRARYGVRLSLRPSGLTGECGCPYGAEGMFCKHCVATALAWLDQEGTDTDSSADPWVKSEAGLRAFLDLQDVTWLVDQLMAAAASDPLLRARLDVAAGADAHDA